MYGMKGARNLAIGLLLVLCQFTAPTRLLAQEGVVSREYAIKAKVIGILGKFVIWPGPAAPSRDNPLTIGILGKDPFVENNINQIDSWADAENRRGAKTVIKRFASAKDYEPCHILFVSNLPAEDGDEKTVRERVLAAQRAAMRAPVLIVGEAAGLSRQGASANLIFDRTSNVIRLEINPDAAARAGLKLAPDLLRLKLVKIVRDSSA